MQRRHLVFTVLVLAGVLLAFLAAKQVAARKAAAPPQTITNSKDGSKMILIPAGEFLMGSLSGEGESYPQEEEHPEDEHPEDEHPEDEHPQHRVYLSAYYMGKYEVTNKQFAKFVKETRYQAQGPWKNYYKSGTAAHPVVNVTWNDAKAYCKWAGLRLPTEAEWEKAARGMDGRKYPWGNEWDEARCNWGDSWDASRSGTKTVGSYSSGASPYGCLDMAGNVWEWCNDWYGDKYYGSSPSSNPEGPGSGQYKVLRGGAWSTDPPGGLRCADRDWNRPDFRDYFLGFRAARSR